jgi:hypothetical protein
MASNACVLDGSPAPNKGSFNFLALADAFYGEGDHRLARLALDSTGIEDHEPLADATEVVLCLEVFRRHVAGTNLLQESAKLWNVPLAIPEFISEGFSNTAQLSPA